MEIKIIALINLLLYSVIASQSFAYVISLTDVQQKMTAAEYISFRKLTDKNFQAKFKKVIYVTLISNVMLLLFSGSQFSELLFTTGAIAFIALIADIAVALKGNIPINSLVNTWSADNYPADWATYKAKWFRAFYKRQVLNISGFVFLLIGVVFG